MSALDSFHVVLTFSYLHTSLVTKVIANRENGPPDKLQCGHFEMQESIGTQRRQTLGLTDALRYPNASLRQPPSCLDDTTQIAIM